MEKHPRFVLKLSLEQMALRRIAVALYSEPHILASFAKTKLKRGGLNSTIWERTDCGDVPNGDWRKTVEDNMLKLQLPKFACEQLKPILKAIALELLEWKSIHEEYLGKPITTQPGCLQKLCWTTVGTLDYRRTAEEILRCSVVSIDQCFVLACLYCLEDYIPVLWDKLPENEKKTFCKERVETPHLQLYLPYIFRTHYVPVYTARNSFEEAAFRGNRALAEFFFRNLAEEEREASLVRSARYLIMCRNETNFPFDFRSEKLSDVICYLLSLMTPEVQLDIFKELPCEVLRCFLDWPWQDLFLEVAKIIFTFLPESKYHDLDFAIDKSLIHSGYYFPSVFQNLFLLCPVEYRKLIVEGEIKWGLYFQEFFKNEDMETVKVILRNIDAADRVRLVCSEGGLQLIAKWTHKWHLVEQFLRAATLTEENKKRLKYSFIEFARNHEPSLEVSVDQLRENYRRFFEFMEASNSSAGNKRCLEDEVSDRTKKLCCEEEENSAE